jgi:hypothetical protein
VKEVHLNDNEVVIHVSAQNEVEQTVVEGIFHVSPPLLDIK